MSEFRNVIIEVRAAGVSQKAVKTAVLKQTGGGSIFFCPPFKDYEPYNGHAHVSPPAGASSISTSPILVGKVTR